MYVVYLLYVEGGGRYVGSGRWLARLIAHARGHSSLASRARPLFAVALAFTRDREVAFRVEAYFQRLLRHDAGRYVRTRPKALHHH